MHKRTCVMFTYGNGCKQKNPLCILHLHVLKWFLGCIFALQYVKLSSESAIHYRHANSCAFYNVTPFQVIHYSLPESLEEYVQVIIL